jgi:hypothetical protein
VPERYVLIRVGSHQRFSTRPCLVRDQRDLDLLKEVGRIVEAANLGVTRAVLFAEQPTMDLILSAEEPQLTATTLKCLLRDYQVVVAALGSYGDLSYVWHMWRHM